MKRKFCYLLLTCDKEQVKHISKTLLDKRLVACVKSVPVGSMYHWKGSIEQTDEVLLLMETAEDLYDHIEAEVSKVHSYETFILQMVSVQRINDKAAAWMDGELMPIHKEQQ